MCGGVSSVVSHVVRLNGVVRVVFVRLAGFVLSVICCVRCVVWCVVCVV